MSTNKSGLSVDLKDIFHSSSGVERAGFVIINATHDGRFITGHDGVRLIGEIIDKKVEFVCFKDHMLAGVVSAMGYPAYYPINPVRLDGPVKAVLMDLDGTTVKSETFWIGIIAKTVGTLLDNSKFDLTDEDLPHVSGHSVSEHLQYCINHYCPDVSLEVARQIYFQHTQTGMDEILKGQGPKDAFIPTEGMKDFLCSLKSMGIKIGLVTSGLYEKAYPEILSAFKTMKMGLPEDFYDSIITAGFPLRNQQPGTLGELSPKPHPWLYAEICRVGLGISSQDKSHVIGIEDSSAGICSLFLAGIIPVGIDGGNIISGGAKPLCAAYCSNFQEILKIIKER